MELMVDLGGPMITADNVLVGVANWVITPCGSGRPGKKHEKIRKI